MQKLVFSFLLLCIVSFTNAQTGRISGTIMDSKTGETLPGATILIEGTSKGASADFDGKFALNNVPAGKVTLVASYISYTSKKIAEVIVKANEVTDINILLAPSSSQDLTEVEVVVTLNKENNTALVLQQKNNASISDGISAETIKRTPDRNTADVLKRISGITIQDDKFVIVRGLNERYNASYLNGSPLPSTEPDKKAFSFDLFPANMLDNIIINKTATPDMPSEFAGGIVQINTKSIPDKNFVSFSAGAGYNTITTGKEKIVYHGGKYDKFGFDDGSRNLSSDVPPLSDKALWIANKDQARVAGYFPNDWASSKSKFSPNSSFQFATGYNIKLKERDFLGVIFSLGYNATQNLYTLKRTEYVGLQIINNDPTQVQKQNETFNDVNQTQTSTGALLNLACKINGNNSISIKNMATGYADNKFITANGINYSDAPDIRNRITSRFFTANQILSSQINGDHLLGKSKIKINWNGGISNVQRTVPNLRLMSYSKNAFHDPNGSDPKDTVYRADIANGQNAGPNYAGYRVYSKLNEKIQNAKLDILRPFTINKDFKIEAKIGAFYQYRTRQYSIRQFGLNQWAPFGLFKDDSLLYLPEDQIFSAQNMSVTPVNTGGFKATEITHADDNYSAKSKLIAYYGMTEFKYQDKIRLIGGVRYESYTQQVNVQYGKIDSIIVKSTINDLLPSVNLIYNISEKLGVRLAYYKTLNRAEFRELAVTNWFDPETRLSIAGNADLQRCYIKNYDARFEIYPGRGQLFTVSGFYKYFNTPIERYMLGGNENQIYYRNANFATVYGGELEYRVNVGAILKKDSVKFLNNLNLFSNLSLIKSEVNVAGLNSKVPDTRVMQGQAPYIINAGISYIDNINNFSITGMVNRVGERIWIVGNEIDGNRWEKARTVVDVQATKSFLKNRLELRINVKDLLHNDYVIYYKGNDRKSNVYDPKVDYINFKRKFGSTYSFVISYKF
ncbi:MAG: carboxypeptidase-like regulatory domain-containing protein [Bacteroidetes bacterium]|nr:carboxypeptidase-like regulatory domain-containing protein [Bacteroidota bacterium]